MSYPIGDMLIRINNAQAVGKEQVSVPFSKIKFRIAQILRDNGLIGDVEKRTKKGRKSDIDYISINLKYEDKKPGMTGFRIISKPSRHLYMGAKEIKPVRSGYGFGIISTSKGVMSTKDAKKQNLGGEIIFEIW